MGDELITSALKPKGQLTIPVEVRTMLKLCEGDIIKFEVHGTRMILSKLEPYEKHMNEIKQTMDSMGIPETAMSVVMRILNAAKEEEEKKFE